MNLKNNIAASLTDVKSEIQRGIKGYKANLNNVDRGIVDQIKTDGYAVLPNYLSKEYCSKAIQEIDSLVLSDKANVNIDKEKSDLRIFGADLKSKLIAEFYNDVRLNDILQTYEQLPYQVGFTLANKLVPTKNNLGSGGGWHRDSASTKQTKAIAYLSDVTENNGPFQYLKGSHKRKTIFDLLIKKKIDLNTIKFTNELIDEIIQDSGFELQTFTATAGTVLLVNTRGLHRGMPIKEGVRYALTNYNWLTESIPSHIKKLF